MPDQLLAAGPFAGRYTIEREIGHGGMATVYLAEETKHGRRVAIKVLRPDVSFHLGPERFLREIGIAARLSHPHLVPLIDSGDADGLLYYVSAFVSGGSLRDRLRAAGPLPVTDAIRIAEEVGAALDFAHRAGLVHRDVKPENILFADSHALLADFGIARICRDEGEAITTAGLVIGTPEYMSPEQATGDGAIDARSDVYSLACVLHEMLTGAPPFHGDSARAIIARHVTEAPRSLRTQRPDVPPAVDAAVLRALAKEPSDRFPSALAFVEALRRAEPAALVPPRVARAVAVLPFVNASGDPENEYLSDGITDELIDALAKVDGLRVASRTSVFALKGKPQDVRAIGALLGCGVVLEGTVRRQGARLRITAQLTSTGDGSLLWSQRYDRQLADTFEIQDEIARTIVTTLRATSFGSHAPPPRRQTHNARAYQHYLKGRYEWNRRTQAGIVEGIRHFEAAIAEDPGYALAYTGLADCYAIGVDYRSVPVHEGFAAAKANARKAIALDDSLAEAHASLAWSLFIYDWNWHEAGVEFRRAIELEPRYAIAHQWYAFLLLVQQRFDEALVEGHTAVELDPGAVPARRSLGAAYYYARRFDQARYHLERAIAMNPTAEESYRTMGLVLAVEGRTEEALHYLHEALTLEGAGSYTQATHAYALARAGRADAARVILAKLEARASTQYVSPVALAMIHVGLGDHARALDLAEHAVDDRRGWVAYLDVNPALDPLRDSPRFDALVRRVGLPPRDRRPEA